MARARQHDSRAENGLHSEALLAARVDCDESSHSTVLSPEVYGGPARNLNQRHPFGRLSITSQSGDDN
jgi:hypothetical protein